MAGNRAFRGGVRVPHRGARITSPLVREAAGIVLHRPGADGAVELLLGHLGGPYWARKDAGAWTVPKGLLEAGEEPLDAARREWREETGTEPPEGTYRALPAIRTSGKLHRLFAVEGDVDAAALASGTFELEWPPRSGRRVAFPEIDRFAWFAAAEARVKLTRALVGLVDEVVEWRR